MDPESQEMPNEPKIHPDQLKFLDLILSQSPDVIYLYDAQKHAHLYFNRELESLLGYTSAEIQAQGASLLLQAIHPDDLGRVQAHIRVMATTASDETYDLEYRIKGKDGSYLWLFVRERVYQRDANQQPEVLFGICQDITRRKRAEERNRYLTRLHATLSQVNQTIVHERDRQTLFEAICKLAIDYGDLRLAWIGLLDPATRQLTPVAMHGKGEVSLPARLMKTENRPCPGSLIDLAIQSGQVQSSEDIQSDPRMAHWRDAAAQGRYHSAAAVPICMNGRLVGLLNLYADEIGFFDSQEEQNLLAEMGLDISFALENMQREAEHRLAESRWQFALEGAGDGLWDRDFRTNEIFYSKQWKAMLGYAEDEIGNTRDEWALRVHPEDKNRCDAELESYLSGRTPIYQSEHRMLCKDGSYKWILDRGRIVERDPAGRPARMIGIHSDITARKQAEETLRESEAALKASQRVAHVGHWTWDTVANRVSWSDEMYHLFGLDAASFDGDLNHVINQAIHPDDRDKVNASNVAVLTEQKSDPIEYRVIWPDGTVHTVWAEPSDQVVDAQGKILKLSGIVQDITQRKQYEKDLRLWADAFMHCAHGIAIGLPGTNQILTCNSAFARLQGLTIEEVVHAPISSMYAESSHAILFKAIREADRTGFTQFIAEMVRKDGTQYPVQMDLVSVLDEQGNVMYRVATQQDITERVQSEARLKSSLAEKETLLRELYHSTKNNMAVIIALLDLQAASSDDARLSQAFIDAKSRVRSMALVHQKLYDAKDLSHINLREYIFDLVQLLMQTYSVSPSRVTVKAEMEDLLVLIDSAMPLGLMINELVSNSLKYAFPHNRQGEIYLGLRRTTSNEIVLQFSDNGIGFPDQFNIRRDGRLGIQTILSLGESQLHGRVEFESSERGVSFRLTFRDVYYQARI